MTFNEIDQIIEQWGGVADALQESSLYDPESKACQICKGASMCKAITENGAEGIRAWAEDMAAKLEGDDSPDGVLIVIQGDKRHVH